MVGHECTELAVGSMETRDKLRYYRFPGIYLRRTKRWYRTKDIVRKPRESTIDNEEDASKKDWRLFSNRGKLIRSWLIPFGGGKLVEKGEPARRSKRGDMTSRLTLTGVIFTLCVSTHPRLKKWWRKTENSDPSCWTPPLEIEVWLLDDALFLFFNRVLYLSIFCFRSFFILFFF